MIQILKKKLQFLAPTERGKEKLSNSQAFHLTGNQETHFNQLQMESRFGKNQEGDKVGKEKPLWPTDGSLMSTVCYNTSGIPKD